MFFFIPYVPTKQELLEEDNNRSRLHDYRSPKEEELFQKKLDACKEGFNPKDNIRYYLLLGALWLLFGYGAGCAVRAAFKESHPKKFETLKVWKPTAHAAIPWATFLLVASVLGYRNAKKANMNPHEWRAGALAESIAKTDRLTREKNLTMGAIRWANSGLSMKLTKLDNRYINGILAADYKTEGMDLISLETIKWFIIAHLRYNPNDYQKIVDGLTGKHIEFTPAFFEDCKSWADLQRSCDEFLVKKEKQEATQKVAGQEHKR